MNHYVISDYSQSEVFVILVAIMREFPIFSLFSKNSNVEYSRIIRWDAITRFEQLQTESGGMKPNIECSKFNVASSLTCGG